MKEHRDQPLAPAKRNTYVRSHEQMAEINEWTFAAEVCSVIERILVEDDELPFSGAKVEQGAKGSRKRRDLTLYDRRGKVVLTGEIKLPDRPDGQSPYASALVNDAFEKANRRGVEYFFTWNVNRFVLWKTFEARKPVVDRDLEHFNVTSIAGAQQLLDPGVRAEIRGFLTQFLGRFARILGGTDPIRSRPLDEKFIRIIESAMELPILQTRAALEATYNSHRTFARDLNAWMRDSQGWTISESTLRDNLERAAKFSCYVLVNRIIFQQALRRRFPSLHKVRIPERLEKGDELHGMLRGIFDEAKRLSRDYETVFDGDFGDKLPFLADEAVASWREFLREIDGFDFSKIDYDIIGHIFERLIGPDERHRYGQHYTRSEIVDLINAFAIRRADATVLDPACGGGTFLVRAYVLKQRLSGDRLTHDQLLQQIQGLDLSAYAAHLSTINLASRDLIDERNYPRVARADFFDVEVGKAAFHIPMSVHGRGKQMAPLNLTKVDSVVANPPYIRQELLSSKYKTHLSEVAHGDFSDANLSGRSDIHCYFWPHAASFLKDSGWLGFLTFSAWLDSGYGFRLQKWLLRHFALVGFFESNCEPWFTGARVTTVASILRREPDPNERASQLVRFVQLRRPLKEVLETFDTDPIKAAASLRDFVERQVTDVVDSRWRIRVLNQHALWLAGCSGAILSGENGRDPQLGGNLFGGDYKGGKWGIYLRAPDVFFDLRDRGGPRLCPLKKVADVRFGLKSGADAFFFVKDVTEDEVARFGEGLRHKWGIRPAETSGIRVVESGDGSRHLLEAEYLEPLVHSLMEIDRIQIDAAELAYKVLLVSDSVTRLRGTHALKYIKWGEREGFDQRVTCQARKLWYEVKMEPWAGLIFPKIQQYRHIVSINSAALQVNSSLLEVHPQEGINLTHLAAILNSTVVALAKQFYGRVHGREASLQLDVYAAESLPVPDPRFISPEIANRLLEAFASMQGRQLRALDEELEEPDRRALDDAVLLLLGFSDAAERETALSNLYREISALYRSMREVEREVQVDRRTNALGGRVTPHSLAEEIWKEFDPSRVRAFPQDFTRPDEEVEIVSFPPGKAAVVHNLFDRGVIQNRWQIDQPRRASPRRVRSVGFGGKRRRSDPDPKG